MDSSLFIAQNSHTRNPQTKLFAGNSHSLRSKTPREVCSLLSFSGILFLLEQFSRKVINTLALFFLNIQFINQPISVTFQTGLLTIIETPTIAGHLLCIVDEEQNICKPTADVKTGIWLSGRFHSANEDG